MTRQIFHGAWRGNRRELLRTVCGSVGGLAVADVLRLRAHAGESANTAAIFVTLGGGPSQFETYDPKPDAAAEYRGVFQSIGTNIPGVRFCELLPLQAQRADRLAIIRSIHHEQASHIAEHIVETGYDLRNSANSRVGEMPSQGAVVSRVRGSSRAGIPGYISLPRHHAYAGAHWLGGQHHHFAINEDPNSDEFRVGNLSPHTNLDATRLDARRSMLNRLDSVSRQRNTVADAAALDAFSQQAFDLVTGERARRAVDIAREDARLRDRYGRNTLGQRMLLARRLVEAGVPFVTVRMGDWDDHDQLEAKIRVRAPVYDTAISALIDDLHDRGLARQVLVVAMGEFGRTPRVNGMAGRDHWPAVNNILLAGGNYRMGQVIGATDSKGAAVVEAPYRPQHVLGMVYRHLGIDPALTFPDYNGRPRHILEQREVIRELL